jgi:hypothetical protein
MKMSLVPALALLLTCAAGHRAAPPEKGERPLQPADLAAIWKDFTQNDDAGSKKAWRGIVAMIQSPQQAVPFLKERVKPAPRPDQKRIDQCLADLDSRNFKRREKAMKDLEAFGQLAVSSLDRKLAEQALSLEARKRMEELALKLTKTILSGDEVRTIRAVEVLEGIGTPEAVAVLKDLAGGGEGAALTEQARKALARLARRPGGR